MTVPVAVGFGYGESDAAAAFAVAAVMTVFAAGLLIIATRGSRAAGTKRENVAATVAVWVVAPLFAALPLYAAGAASGALNAWFESVSGLTTTGATAIGPIEAAGHATLIWRAMLQWLGGVATVMTVVVHLAHLGVGGMQLYPGAMLHGEQDPLLERLASTGLAVSAVFAILAAACFVALLATGIPAFDAVAHALATVSTGGFSTRDGSVGAFANPAAEAVLIVFMVLGAANASLHWLVVRRRNPREYWRDPEFLRFVSVAALAAAAISVALAALSGVEAGEAIRHGAFAAVSAITTTGFSTGGDIAWPLLAPLLLLVLMLAGGCTGSTAGGLKTMRVFLLLRLARREITRLSHPHGVEEIRYGRMRVEPEAMRAVWAFFVVVLFGFGALSVLLALSGLEFRDAVYAAAGALSNTVPAAAYFPDGIASFDDQPAAARVLMGVGMLLGRLEFFTVLILLNPLFWRR
ncbi:MAG: potassium transporter [Proteobacteria bacterium]|nr:potassium transporter [Pseudomonadota bacterium]